MKPKMILFDYGQTLIGEPQFDWTAANLAFLAHITNLPQNASKEALCRELDDLFSHIIGRKHEHYRELEHEKILRLFCDVHGFTLDIPLEEADLIYWDTATHGSFASPGAAEFLDYLDQNGIRTGVISNMCYANDALCTRLARYLPNHRFEFVITSSDYILRKPEPLLFAVACRRFADMRRLCFCKSRYFVRNFLTAEQLHCRRLRIQRLCHVLPGVFEIL